MIRRTSEAGPSVGTGVRRDLRPGTYDARAPASIDRPTRWAAGPGALARPAISSLIIGATKVEQLQDNIASLEVKLTAEQMTELNAAGALDLLHPYMFFTGMLHRERVFGGTDVEGWR